MPRRTINTVSPDPEVIEMRQSLAQRITAVAGKAGEHSTAIPGLFLYYRTRPTPCYRASYEPSLSVFVQGRKHFYFIDESSLASTNQIRDFLTRIGPQDRVLLIGDIRQHQGVEAGRPFEQLQEAGMRTAKLDEIVCQKDPALKSAVELLAKGQVSPALELLQQQGRVREIPDVEERVRAIARSYVESPEKTLPA